MNQFQKLIRQDISQNGPAPDPDALITSLPEHATVADIGCHGWRLAAACRQSQAQLIGFDTAPPPNKPASAAFMKMKGHKLICQNNIFDACVASHVIEHMSNPIGLISEMLRITKPGGVIWIEAPSELSTRSTADTLPEMQAFDCFWDDPTHVRPQTPRSLYRLAISAGLIPIQISRINKGIDSVRMMAIKPEFISGAVSPRYVTLRETEPGALNAYSAIWPEHRSTVATLFEQEKNERSHH